MNLYPGYAVVGWSDFHKFDVKLNIKRNSKNKFAHFGGKTKIFEFAFLPFLKEGFPNYKKYKFLRSLTK